MSDRFSISRTTLPDLAILTICTSDAFSAQLGQMLENAYNEQHVSEFEAYLSADRRPALGTQVQGASMRLAFIDFDRDPAQAVKTAEYLTTALQGGITLVAVSGTQSRTTLLAAMRCGCTEFLTMPLQEDALLDIFTRTTQRLPAVTHARRSEGEILSFFGAKGGVGTTTLAVHLATYLVKCHGKRVLLIDHHAELGHVCIYLGLDGTRFNLQEVIRNVNRLDSELLRGLVADHASGLQVLSSPDRCVNSRPMEPHAIAQTLEFLRSEYDYVIVDCASPNDQVNLPVVDASSSVYLVATPEVGSIRDLSRYVDMLNGGSDATGKVKVVINRASSTYAIAIDQIERALKMPVSFRIGSSYQELVRCDNLGEPVSPDSKCDFASQMLKWSSSIAGAATVAPRQERKKNNGFKGFFKSSRQSPVEVKLA